MLIHACVSAHGFGHGSRTAAVLTALHERFPHWRLVLSTALPPAFLATALGPVPFEIRPCSWDVGMLQADALGSDPDATLEALEQLERRLPQQIAREAAWLRAQEQPLLLLGDVPPAAALLAEQVGAPLIWLASFGWEAIYRPLGGAFTAWAERCEQLYRRGDLLLQCPLALPMAWGLPTRPLGLTAGEPRLDAGELARQLALPADRQRCVLLSFGGLGLRLDPGLLSLWPDWTFLGHDPALASAANGRVLPADLRPLEVMRLCGRLITKPGYSSFCEAMGQNVGIHAVHRVGFAEAPVLEQALQRHGHHRLLSQRDLQAGRWQLDQPLHRPTHGPLPPDGTRAAAAAIAAFAAERGLV
ncbi:conserved hypothetical protein [Cyanobium sp. PCC 7001]|uniref:hypothetical protein n=1 Tax=Cyanobium sp. PCC 7001 TaxID=180281 RepID=UPI0001804AFA|nr:hypothetical protein [Cyanobium sp. PCC 7001]EDY39270.1 conserved hypothetical protein [Cyanobium sp. PCC 7001]